MKTLLLGFSLKNKGILFTALFFAPFFDWISDKLGINHMPLKMLGIIILFVLVDIALGLTASIKNKDNITSKKGFQSVWKIIFYTLFLYAISQLGLQEGIKGNSFLIGLLKYIQLSTYTLALLWEIHSWGENYNRIYGSKPRFFIFLESIAEAFEKLILNNIKDKIDDIEDGKSKDNK